MRAYAMDSGELLALLEVCPSKRIMEVLPLRDCGAAAATVAVSKTAPGPQHNAVPVLRLMPPVWCAGDGSRRGSGSGRGKEAWR